MSLVESLRSRLADQAAASFQLMGEDLALLSGVELRQAAARYETELGRVPAALRPAFEREQAEVSALAHQWLRKYNRSVHTRLRGYAALGRRLAWQYPWPVVAMLGICTVLTGLRRNRVFGLVGDAADRAGFALPLQLIEGAEDALRRTNRGIFADSVPSVLYALHAHAVRERGDGALAEALLDGPLLPTMDGESRVLARGLFEGLKLTEGPARFRTLADLTLRHFAREQAIFSYHLGLKNETESGLVTRFSTVRAVPAPVISRGLRGSRLSFRPYALPAGFDIRDHALRVREFGHAYVTSLVGTVDDYITAAAYVVRRFGHPGERVDITF